MTDIKPGLYNDIPFEEYLGIDAFSKSKVLPILQSPMHLRNYQRFPLKSAALTLGSLADTLIFEPELFPKRFALQPKTYVDAKGVTKPWNLNSTKCKETLANLQESGKDVISESEYREATALKNAVKSHKTASGLLDHGDAQVSLIWVDPDCGMLCKARLDLLNEQIVELKSTRDASVEGFPREINKYGYHIQNAVYVDGYKAVTGEDKDFVFVALEKGLPYAVGTYMLGKDSVEVGRSMYKRALYLWKSCKNLEEWPGYSDFIEPIDLPGWVLRQELGDEVYDDGF